MFIGSNRSCDNCKAAKKTEEIRLSLDTNPQLLDSGFLDTKLFQLSINMCFFSFNLAGIF